MIEHVTVDPYSEVPLYIQLADLIRADIVSGKLPPRTPIPSAATLVGQHEVSRGTADKAVGVLKAEGFVRRVPGRGMYVLPREEWPKRKR
jgi:GntR family transcriptional regulator